MVSDPNTKNFDVDIDIDKRIFVGGCPRETTENDLKSFFETYGIVERVNIVKDRKSGLAKCAFVTFDSEEVRETLCLQESIKFQGKTVRIGKAQRSKGSPERNSGGAAHEFGRYFPARRTPQDYMSSTDPISKNSDIDVDKRIFLKGCPRETTENDLKSFFETYGIVKSVNIVKDHKSGLSKFAFVTFDSKEVRETLCLQETIKFQGKTVRIGEAKRSKGSPTRQSSLDYTSSTAPLPYYAYPFFNQNTVYVPAVQASTVPQIPSPSCQSSYIPSSPQVFPTLVPGNPGTCFVQSMGSDQFLVPMPRTNYVDGYTDYQTIPSIITVPFSPSNDWAPVSPSADGGANGFPKECLPLSPLPYYAYPFCNQNTVYVSAVQASTVPQIPSPNYQSSYIPSSPQVFPTLVPGNPGTCFVQNLGSDVDGYTDLQTIPSNITVLSSSSSDMASVSPSADGGVNVFPKVCRAVSPNVVKGKKSFSYGVKEDDESDVSDTSHVRVAAVKPTTKEIISQ